MPWRSKRQQRWGHTAAGKRALGKRVVAEFDRATKRHGRTRKGSRSR